MSDFIFARKTSNLILLCSAKVRKPTEHQQVTLNPLAMKGTIAEKPLYTRMDVFKYTGFPCFGSSLGAKNRHLSVLLARLRAKFDCSGGHQWHQPTLQRVFCGLHNVTFPQAKSQANSQTELSIYQQVTAMCHKQTHKQTHKQSHKQNHKQKQCNKWYR